MKQLLWLCLIFMIAIGISGCGAIDPDPVIGQVLTSIIVSPSSAIFARDSGLYKFTATGYDQNNVPMSVSLSWSASQEAGSINSNGWLDISSEAGTGKVKAYSGTVEGTSSITVTGGTLESITVVPSSVILPLSTTSYTFTATAKDHLGGTVDIYPAWSVTPVATIAVIGLYDGIFVPISSGECQVIASMEAGFGTSEVTVTD
ncbi:hypothetical protein ACFLZ2_00165 [Candidatus Margulisiibacteriota bacterium]